MTSHGPPAVLSRSPLFGNHCCRELGAFLLLCRNGKYCCLANLKYMYVGYLSNKLKVNKTNFELCSYVSFVA